MSSFDVKLHKLEVEPHPGADRLDIVRIAGYQAVSQKGRFKTGDFALYVPEQAIVPERILKAGGFWLEEKERGMLAGSKGDRVKPIKLRGVLSQGILLAPEDVFETHVVGDHTMIGPVEPDKDYAPDLGIVKYVPVVPPQMSGEVEPCDGITSYTDIENIKKYPDAIDKWTQVLITEKLHGTCCVFFFKDNHLYVSSKGLASKGLCLVENEHNVYWKLAKKYQIADVLGNLCNQTGEDRMTLYGEGIGIQDLKYGSDKNDLSFRAFDLRRSDGTFLDAIPFRAIMQAIGMPLVPDLYTGPHGPEVIPALTDGVETITGEESHIREGIVIRPLAERHHPEIGRLVLKSVSERYLLRTGDATEYE